MCRGSGVVAAEKKLTTINLPGSSSELAVGVHLVTHPILQRDHNAVVNKLYEVAENFWGWKLKLCSYPSVAQPALRSAERCVSIITASATTSCHWRWLYSVKEIDCSVTMNRWLVETVKLEMVGVEQEVARRGFRRQPFHSSFPVPRPLPLPLLFHTISIFSI